MPDDLPDGWHVETSPASIANPWGNVFLARYRAGKRHCVYHLTPTEAVDLSMKLASGAKAVIDTLVPEDLDA